MFLGHAHNYSLTPPSSGSGSGNWKWAWVLHHAMTFAAPLSRLAGEGCDFPLCRECVEVFDQNCNRCVVLWHTSLD